MRGQKHYHFPMLFLGLCTSSASDRFAQCYGVKCTEYGALVGTSYALLEYYSYQGNKVGSLVERTRWIRNSQSTNFSGGLTILVFECERMK